MAAKEPRKPPIPVMGNLIASGVAVVGATVLTHPIDVVKVRLQVAKKSSAAADSFSLSRFVRIWPKLAQREGAGAFVKGINSAAVRAATYGSARIGLCEPLQGALGSQTGGALLAGVAATIVGNPMEVLKVRLQARKAGAAVAESEFRAFSAMLKQEGASVLVRGFHWAAGRSAMLTASQVVPYESAKKVLQERAGLPNGLALHLLASLAAGAVTTTTTAPLDVLKTRAMQSTSSGAGVVSMLRQEGVFVLFRGWLANYVRIGPQTLFILVFYEQTRGFASKLYAKGV